jgi:hypothetical protein
MRRVALSLLSLGLLFGGCGTSGGSAGGSEATGGTSSAGTGGSGAKATGGSPGGGGTPTQVGTGGTSSAGTGGIPGAGGSAKGTGGSASDAAAASDSGPAVSDPGGAPCPKCVKIFNGTSFEGWEANPATWTIVGGAMRGFGGPSRAAYTKADYGNVRLIVTSRLTPANGDHLGILFWGNRPMDPMKPQIDTAGWVQWMPPFGGMWSYHPPMHHSLKAMKLADAPVGSGVWHTTELLLNLDKGTLRSAVNGVETTRYTHEWPTERTDPTKRIIKGPIAMMKHGGGGSEYKDIWVEVEPTEDKLLTVK